jgi:hypothetical protein
MSGVCRGDAAAAPIEPFHFTRQLMVFFYRAGAGKLRIAAWSTSLAKQRSESYKDFVKRILSVVLSIGCISFRMSAFLGRVCCLTGETDTVEFIPAWPLGINPGHIASMQ